METKISELSVFFPTYNEEGSIKKVVYEAKQVLQKITSKWEIIIIDDGSTDKTKKVSQDIAKEDKHIRVITQNPNKGYGAALNTGFYNAKYNWIAFTDSDGQFVFSEINEFIKKQRETNADLVIGYYKKRQVSFTTILTSKLWEIVVFVMFGLKVRDIDCGFKLISKDVFAKIPHLESERGAFVSSELLIKAKRAGFKIEEVPVTHNPRKKGEGTGRNINVIIKSFVDLFKLWQKQL